MYALVEIKGKQYKVEKGSTVKVNRLASSQGDSVEFETVLMVKDGEDVKIGTPFIEGVKVTATVEEHGKDKKVVIFKMKKRKNYRRKQGFRNRYSMIKIEDIVGLN